MEHYVRGETASGDAHNRAVTEQDRRELEKTRNVRDHMKARHNSAINVLRGEQNRRMSGRLQQQELQLEQLDRKQERELVTVQNEYEAGMREWDDEVGRKKARMEAWWHMQVEIWRKRLEQDNGIVLEGIIPLVVWVDNGRPDDEEESPANDADGIESELPRLPPVKNVSGISTSFTLKKGVVGKA